MAVSAACSQAALDRSCFLLVRPLTPGIENVSGIENLSGSENLSGAENVSDAEKAKLSRYSF